MSYGSIFHNPLGSSCSVVCYHINEKLSTMGYASIFHNPLGSSCSVVRYHINEKLSTMGYELMPQYFITSWEALVQWCGITLMRSFLQWVMAQCFITC
jgi:hypothetical protein